MEIVFDAERHEYTVDGKAVPSVTQIVAPLGADYDDNDDMELVFEAAADRGTTMHAYIEHRLQGGEIDDFELPDIYEPYAEAVELLLAEHTIVPFAIETPFGCDFFAGTPDLICEFDGEISILDWKFVSQIAKSKVGAQLGGYQNLCESSGIFPTRLIAVQFLRDGVYRLYPAERKAAEESFALCMELWRLKTKKHPRGRIE